MSEQPSDDDLVRLARAAAAGAYAPYSGFRVGAVVLAADGRVFTSANVENAAYPVSQCAEANAVNYAASQGARRIAVVAVACLDAADLEGAYPCGRCRQIMSEFDVGRVIVAAAEGPARSHTIDDLLPHRFRLTER
jgi:cytidine deaminase